MTQVSQHTETTTRRVYKLSTPTNGTELSKALVMANADLERRGIEYYDDTLQVTTTDDELIISYMIPEEKR